MQCLLQHITTYYSLSEDAQQAISNSFQEVVLAKDKYLVKRGQVCTQLYFLEQGALRGFYHAGDKEITHWFGFENHFVTSFYSFTTGQPAVENIQLLEGCLLWSLSKDKMIDLCNQHHEIERVVRIAYENYYIKLEERFVNAQFKSAKELYENLLQQAPYIIERVPLGYIASYLGITPETLSRVRSRL